MLTYIPLCLSLCIPACSVRMLIHWRINDISYVITTRARSFGVTTLCANCLGNIMFHILTPCINESRERERERERTQNTYKVNVMVCMTRCKKELKFNKICTFLFSGSASCCVYYIKAIRRTVPGNNFSRCLFYILYFAATYFGPCWPSSGGMHNYFINFINIT
jgi:hypothetical protein